MEEKKKGKGLVILVILLVVVILGLVGYICYDKGLILSKKSQVENKNEKVVKTGNSNDVEEEALDTLTDEIRNLYEEFLYPVDQICGAQEYYYQDTKVEAKDISNDMAYLTVIGKYFDNKNDIPADEINNLIKSYFGSDYVFNPEDIDVSRCVDHIYDKASNTYKYRETVCGGTCGPVGAMIATERISKIVKKGNNIEITARVLFPSKAINGSGKISYYSDFNRTKLVDGIIYDSDDLLYLSDDNYKKGGEYKFNLKLENDNYVFVSSYPVN